MQPTSSSSRWFVTSLQFLHVSFLLISLLVPWGLFLINLCGSLVEVLRRWYKQIYVLLYHPTTLGLYMFHNRFKKIYIAFKNMSFNRQHKESRSRWWWSDCRYCLIGPAIFVWLSKKSLLLGFPAIL